MIGPMELSRLKLFCSSLLQDAFLVAVLLASPVERIVAKAGADQSSDSGWPRSGGGFGGGGFGRFGGGGSGGFRGGGRR